VRRLAQLWKKLLKSALTWMEAMKRFERVNFHQLDVFQLRASYEQPLY
jgi:hypothetical protein